MFSVSEQQGVLGPVELGYTVHDLAVTSTSSLPNELLVACSSFIPEASNFVDILTLDVNVRNANEVVRRSTRLPHYYPPTRVRWLEGADQPLLVSSGDGIRVWSASGMLQRLLRHEANPQGRCTPITSVDCCPSSSSAASAHQIASCDIYGICALWDTERGSMQQAVDLGQPLCDVAFGSDGLLAVAGELGDCFLLDPRQPEDVMVLAPKEKVRGPARIAWEARRTDLFSVAWQGEEGAVALYSTRRHSKDLPRVLRSPAAGTVADLQWSPAFPEFFALAKEEGTVEVWQFPEQGVAAATAANRPSFQWTPSPSTRCTALGLTREVKQGQHLLVLATMPSGQLGCNGPQVASSAGSLWLAGLPPAPSRSSQLFGSTSSVHQDLGVSLSEAYQGASTRCSDSGRSAFETFHQAMPAAASHVCAERGIFGG